jgi:PAS domain S-box-containing protein
MTKNNPDRPNINELRRARAMLKGKAATATHAFHEAVQESQRLAKQLNQLLQDRAGQVGKLTEALATAVTARTRAEDALMESERRYTVTADVVPVLIWQAGPDKLCTSFNKRWLEFTGRRLEDELANGWIAGIHPEDVQACVEKYHSAFDKRETFVTEYRLRHHSGQHRWILDRGAPVFSTSGTFRGYVGGCIDIHAQKIAEASLQRSRQELRTLASRLQAAQEEERAQLAREIHDELSGTLTALKLDISLLPDRAAKDRDSFLEKLESMSGLIDRTLTRMHSIVTELRPIVLDKFGLVAAIDWQIKDFQDRSGIGCEIDLPKKAVSLDPDRATAIFRILQEALTNVVRHAQATKVRVELKSHNKNVSLMVRDNGKGIAANEIDASTSIGLLSMRERALSFGGVTEITTIPEGGTSVSVRMPPSHRLRR